MGFDQVKAGKDVPNDINVIIEISAQGDPIKFEVDKDSGAIFVDRFMGTSMRYPINYGYVPHTVAGDGEFRVTENASLFPVIAEALGVEKLRILQAPTDTFEAAREQWDDGNNFLAVSPGVIFGYERNTTTNTFLRRNGIEVVTMGLEGEYVVEADRSLLTRALKGLDYPASKLEVKLVLEEDDLETMPVHATTLVPRRHVRQLVSSLEPEPPPKVSVAIPVKVHSLRARALYGDPLDTGHPDVTADPAG